MPLWDVEEDKPIVVGPNPSAIKDWTSDQIAETTVKLVMMLGAKPGAPPMNPLAWSYVIGDDPRYNFCGVALMMLLFELSVPNEKLSRHQNFALCIRTLLCCNM